jgi:hypothetical protein
VTPQDPNSQTSPSVPDGLVCTVSTVKDTLPRVQRFVTRNLAGGVDHLFVFLEAPDPAVRDWLAAHPHVTSVDTGDDAAWWRGDRPAQLNQRQRINANAAAVVLAGLGWPAWLFHIDGDEVVQVDRERLAAAPAARRAARLGVLEAVAQPHWDGPPTWFKRPLGEPELVLLATLGLIDKPRNGAYFHGHADGKCGIRPGPDAWLTIHDPVDDAGHELATYADDGLRVLHYESYSGDEFVRKWLAMAGAGSVRFRPGRQATLVAVKALLDQRLPTEVTERYLMRIFEETTADDLDTLRDLGLLVEVDPDRGQHRPTPLGDDRRAALDAALAEVAAGPKGRFRPPVNRPVDRDAPPASGATEKVRAGRRFRLRS